MKRIISLSLVFLLCLSLFPMAVLAAPGDTFTSGAFVYEELDASTVAVVGLSGSSVVNNPTIPSSVQNSGTTYTVTSVKKFAFFRSEKLTGKLTLPSTLVQIGEYSFAGCDQLTGTLDLPASLQQVDESAFEGCTKLSGVLTLPSSLQAIGPFAFSRCTSFTGSLVIPASVTQIGSFAFTQCNGINTIVFLHSTPPAIGYTIADNISSVYYPASSSAMQTALNGKVGSAQLRSGYVLTIDAGITNGSMIIQDSKKLAAAGETISLTVNPSVGYTVSGATFNGTPATKISTNTYEFSMPASDVVVSATFATSSTTDAAAPVISASPVDRTVNKEASLSLAVTASSSDGGTLSYQWYQNSSKANIGGTPISLATDSSLSVNTATVGTFYYYCVVTNTNSAATGAKTASSTTSAVSIIIQDSVTNAAAPVISSSPTDKTVKKGASLQLSVTAFSSDGGTLSYQWYQNSSKTSTGGTPISLAIGSSLSVNTATVGTFYYYCVVTNTNSAASGTKTASSTANAVSVVIQDDSGGGGGVGGGGGGVPTVLISATADKGGSISPSGDVFVSCKSSQTFSITFEKGYRILDVKVDGISVGPVTSYIFNEVNENHKISVSFKKAEFSSCEGGDACPSHLLKDVTPAMWHHEYVDFVLERAFMQGISPTEFAPEQTLSRAMLAQILYNAENNPSFEGKFTYHDVPKSAWYSNAVHWSYGLINGYGSGYFGPEDAITREQLAAILYRYAEKKGLDLSASGNLSAYSDGDKISSWAENALKWAIGNKLITGRDNGTLDPSGTASRAEVAAILSRYFLSFDL